MPVEACRLRCQYYLAASGDPESAAAIAGEAATVALRDINERDDLRMVGRALGWSVMARTLEHTRNVDGLYAPRRSLAHTLHGYERDFEAAIQRAVRTRELEQKEVSADDAFVLDLEDETVGASDMDGSVVVFTSIGNNTTSEGKRVVKEFEQFVGRRLPPDAPDLAAVRKQLTTEFPWAVSVADEMLKGLVGRKDVRFRPTILLGPPGCGKTRFSRRLIEELGVPYDWSPAAD